MMRLEQEPTSVYEPMIFSAEVLSYLPFTESTSREEYPYAEFMIDDERIVCLSVRGYCKSHLLLCAQFSDTLCRNLKRNVWCSPSRSLHALHSFLVPYIV